MFVPLWDKQSISLSLASFPFSLILYFLSLSQAKSNLRELEGDQDGRKEESKDQGHHPRVVASGGPREQPWGRGGGQEKRQARAREAGGVGRQPVEGQGMHFAS